MINDKEANSFQLINHKDQESEFTKVPRLNVYYRH